MHEFLNPILDFIRENAAWGAPILGLLAFGESLAVVGFFLPATVVLIASGGLVQAGILDFWTVLAWGIPGAVLGDAVSYWAGRHLRDRVPGFWPFRNRPQLLQNGYRFFARFGWLAVFIGRFSGPLRAVVPLIAGMLAMPHWRFQAANVASAIIWVPMLLLPGAVVGGLLQQVEAWQVWLALGLIFAGVTFLRWLSSR